MKNKGISRRMFIERTRAGGIAAAGSALFGSLSWRESWTAARQGCLILLGFLIAILGQ